MSLMFLCPKKGDRDFFQKLPHDENAKKGAVAKKLTTDN